MLPAVMVLVAWWIDASWKQLKLATAVAVGLAIILPLSVTLVIPRILPNSSRRVGRRG